MSDSDSECEMVKVKSFQGHKFAPSDKNFSIIIKPKEGKKRGFMYTLNSGQTLPYAPTIIDCDCEITFGQDLKPDMGQAWLREIKKDCWIFTEIDSTSLDENLSPGKPIHSSSVLNDMDSSFHGVSRVGEEDMIEKADKIKEKPPQTEQEKIMSLFNINRDNSRLCEFSCKLCSYVSDWEDSCIRHMKSEHPGWKEDLPGSDDSLSQDLSGHSSAPSTSCQNIIFGTTGQTPNTNPEWLDTLKQDFQKIIVDKCSERSRNAIANDEDVKDFRVRKMIRAEIMDLVIDHLFTFYGGFGIPKLPIMREVTVLMGFKFPNMFQDKGLSGRVIGYGLGGKHGNKHLPDHMIERFKAVVAKACGGEAKDDEGDAVEPEKKKVKKKEVYGVNQQRFYEVMKDTEAVDTISKLSGESDFSKREEVFSKNRKVLQHQFRTSNKMIQKICRSFFMHYQHLASHFVWLTGAPSLCNGVEENLYKQLDFLLKYLHHVNRGIEFAGKMDGIDTIVQTEYEGDRTYKDIQILRFAGSELDKDGSSLFKLEKELPPNSASPFILAVEIPSTSWVFEVWVEQEKLLGNLSLAGAISSLIHLVFIFDLKYNRDSQTMADILQRKFAGYGDDSGTKTSSSKQTAKSKYTKYLMTLGEILSKN